MKPFLAFATYIDSHRKALADEVLDLSLTRMDLHSNFPEWRKERVLKQFRVVLELLAEAIFSEQDEVIINKDCFLLVWGQQVAAHQLELGETISIIFDRFPIMKSSFNRILTELSVEHGLTLRENAYVLDQTNLMMDRSMQELITTFERLVEEQDTAHQLELAKLSAPIVPVREDVVIIPLVGEMDSYRAKYIMENTIPKIASSGTRFVIADFSGLLTLNTEVLSLLHQMGGVLRLMGFRVVSTGIRPDLVQAAVKNGITLTAGEHFTTVKQALSRIK